MRYRVLKNGVWQRSGDRLKAIPIGTTIVVSEKAASRLIERGFIECEGSSTYDDGPRCPDHPRYRGKGDPRDDCGWCREVYEATHREDAS